jgi:hypothetical protein
MVARRAVSFSLALLLLSASGLAVDKPKTKWTKVPDGFRGVKFGATKAEAESVLGPLRCSRALGVKPEKMPTYRRDGTRASVPTPPHEVCATTDKAKAFRAGEKVIGTDYIFDEGRFVAVKLRRIETMSSSKVLMFSDIRPILESWYGPPTEENNIHEKGIRQESIATWDPKQNKSVSKSYPVKVDYTRTCLRWDDAAVEVGLCSGDRVFERGEIETAAWLQKQSAWFDQDK